MPIIKRYGPGILLLLGIAFISTYLASLFPEYIGSVFIAVLLGIIINNTFNLKGKIFDKGVKLGLSKFLKLAIILLGAGISFRELLQIGGKGLLVILVVISGAFILTFLLGNKLDISLRKKLLIAAGLSICGNTAIVTTAPLIEAREEEICMAVSIVTIFGVVAVFLYPLIGVALGLTDLVFGAWAGTAIYDTSQVVATGFIFSDQAGEIATMIKLTRNVLMVPVILLIGYFYRKNAAGGQEKVNIIKIFPTFILGFLLLAILNSMGFLSPAVSSGLKTAAKFLIVVALSGIGLGVDLKQIKNIGMKPFITGFTVAISMALISYTLNILLFG